MCKEIIAMEILKWTDKQDYESLHKDFKDSYPLVNDNHPTTIP